MSLIQNPILPGFHPDPSILRVGQDYYIATSTFEWWPGIRIHHSRDLANWRLLGHALVRPEQINLRGVQDSGGIWAPALSHADGVFWLTYSDVRGFNGFAKDVRNYLVTAKAISGPWSKPVPLNSSGFDPSLFHDDDGRKWLLNQRWDPRPDRNQFAGIELREYDPQQQKLVGEAKLIFPGTALGCSEGPHIYKRSGYYYLVIAEGGTGEAHAVTVARAKNIFGPYETCPANPILTSANQPEAPLQKAGHASLVETPTGQWYLVHLCSRPLGPQRRCILGRETAIQAINWPESGWPALTRGGNLPAVTVEIPGTAALAYLGDFKDNFSASALDPHWSTLREAPEATWLTLAERPGCLRLRGRNSLLSPFDQSLVGFRLLHHHGQVSVRLDFAPRNYQQSAGLVVYYNTTQFHYLMITGRDGEGRELRLLCGDAGQYTNPLNPAIMLPDSGPVDLGAELEGTTQRFKFRIGTDDWQLVEPVLDATLISDDRVIENGAWGFTGAFIGLCAQDSADSNLPADFEKFCYHGFNPKKDNPLPPWNAIIPSSVTA